MWASDMKFCTILCLIVLGAHAFAASKPGGEIARKYVSQFNADDEEPCRLFIPNADAEKFISDNVPVFECPDAEIERAYYFRR